MVPATGRVGPSRTRSIGRDRSLERLSADSQKTVSQFEFWVGTTAVIGDDDLRQLILQLKEDRRAIWRRK